MSKNEVVFKSLAESKKSAQEANKALKTLLLTNGKGKQPAKEAKFNSEGFEIISENDETITTLEPGQGGKMVKVTRKKNQDNND